jgi:DNA replication initiation complex subunit (GINS family)
MKRILLLAAVFSLLAVPLASRAQSETRDRGTGKGMPMPELMFYEAAEQAVEDGYAEIIPSSETDKKTADSGAEEGKKNEPAPAAADTGKDEPAGQPVK